MYQGTDAVVYGLPVDFTCDFRGINHMVAYEEMSFEISGIGRVQFGVRTGSSRVKFDTPVLVIGIETPYNIRQVCRHLFENIWSSIGRIVDTGSEVYWQYCDVNGL